MFARVERKWGYYIDIIRTPWLCIKILFFNPASAISHQRHFKRNELWFILSNIGEMDYGCQSKYLVGGDFFFIEKNQWHKFSTLNHPCKVLEIQYGSKSISNNHN